MLGVMTVQEALDQALKFGLDLVEISPNVDPPVCKILDYGKYRYEEQKRRAAARKNQKIVEIKEIKLRPTIEENDYQVKLKSAKKFLEEGDKVKVTMRFRGRELAHQDLALKVLNRFCDDLEHLGKVEVKPKLEGRQMMLMIASQSPKA
jgi:translation initiation factor IF-3